MDWGQKSSTKVAKVSEGSFAATQRPQKQRSSQQHELERTLAVLRIRFSELRHKIQTGHLLLALNGVEIKDLNPETFKSGAYPVTAVGTMAQCCCEKWLFTQRQSMKARPVSAAPSTWHLGEWSGERVGRLHRASSPPVRPPPSDSSGRGLCRCWLASLQHALENICSQGEGPGHRQG